MQSTGKYQQAFSIKTRKNEPEIQIPPNLLGGESRSRQWRASGNFKPPSSKLHHQPFHISSGIEVTPLYLHIPEAVDRRPVSEKN